MGGTPCGTKAFSPERRQADRAARWSAVGLLLSVAVILACTLYPFRFDLHRSVPGPGLRLGPDRGVDVIENLALYAPAGFALSRYLAARQVRLRMRWSAVLIGAVVLSYSTEFAQHFLPGRFSSLTDVLSNVAGAALGHLWGRPPQQRERHIAGTSAIRNRGA